MLLSEDDWLSSLFPNQTHSFDDYLTFSAVIKPLVKSHVQDILKSGTNVVLDFPANTVKQRSWFKQLSDEVGCEHELISLNFSDELCLSQISKRHVEQPERVHFDNETVFKHVTKFFAPPSDDDGINIVEVIRK